MTRNDDKLETALVLALLAVLLATGQVHAGIMFSGRDLTETVMRGDVAPDSASAGRDPWTWVLPWMFGGGGGSWGRCGPPGGILKLKFRSHIKSGFYQPPSSY